jgi:hypothetical protein
VPGLPDGIFPNQKSQFGQTLEGLAMEDVGIINEHLVYFTAIWYIFDHLVYSVVNLNISSRFGMLNE